MTFESNGSAAIVASAATGGDLLARIHARCYEEGDCLIWDGPVSMNGQPRLALHPGGSLVTLRRPCWEAYHGKPVPAGLVVSAKCGHKLCLSRKCLIVQTVAEARALAASFGAYRNAARQRKAAMTRRAKSHISEEMVERIRAAESAAQAAAETGVCLASVYQIREGYRRAPLVTVFSGLGAR